MVCKKGTGTLVELGEEDYNNITRSLYKLNAVEKLSYVCKKTLGKTRLYGPK